jgi:hypothetical protein
MRLKTILQGAEVRVQGALVGTVLTPTLRPASGPQEQRAAPRRCARESVAFGNYVAVSEPPGANRTRISENTPSRRSMNPATANL